jgi:hypothetical protein
LPITFAFPVTLLAALVTVTVDGVAADGAVLLSPL